MYFNKKYFFENGHKKKKRKHKVWWFGLILKFCKIEKVHIIRGVQNIVKNKGSMQVPNGIIIVKCVIAAAEQT
jgi:hypothetical protein